MALDEKNVNPGGAPAGPGPGLYTYTTTDTAATIETDGHFDAMADRWETGDVLIAHNATNTKIYRITKTTGDIALSAGLVIT